MPRPHKCRRVCSLPHNCGFYPRQTKRQEAHIILTVEEYEVIRLIDLLNYTQESCANQMEVARTTVQKIYADARKKLADALINQKPLIVEGGNFRLCSKTDSPCHSHCHRSSACPRHK